MSRINGSSVEWEPWQSKGINTLGNRTGIPLGIITSQIVLSWVSILSFRNDGQMVEVITGSVRFVGGRAAQDWAGLYEDYPSDMHQSYSVYKKNRAYLQALFISSHRCYSTHNLLCWIFWGDGGQGN